MFPAKALRRKVSYGHYPEDGRAYEVTPENPTFCVVIDSTLLVGLPSSATFTRILTNIRQGLSSQTT